MDKIFREAITKGKKLGLKDRDIFQTIKKHVEPKKSKTKSFLDAISLVSKVR